MSLSRGILFGGSLLALGVGLAAGNAASVSAPVIPVQRPALLQSAADDDWSAKRKEYEDKARQQYDEWRQKMSDWSGQAKEKGQELSAEAKAKMDRAWSDMKADWRTLKKASHEQWDKARAAYEDAAQRVADEWHKMHPQD
jgi:hypothetical protein